MQKLFEKFRINPYGLSGAGGALAILTFPLSVSLSQLGLFIALAGWAVDRAMGGKKLPFIAPRPLLFALGIYGAEVLSLLVHLPGAPHPLEAIRNAFKDEIKDVWLMGMAFWVISYSQDMTGRKRIYSLLKGSMLILIGTGFLSLFSKFRLSKIPYHMMYGWTGSADARFQHFFTTLFPGRPWEINIFEPIGFMNTHLTYAALLMFAIPFLFFRVLHPFVISPRSFFKWRNLVYVALLAIAGLVLYVNNGRSAIIGLGSALCLGFYSFVRNRWRKRALRLLPIALGGLLFLGVLTFFLPRVSEKMENAVVTLFGEDKHTDYQRIFVWQGSIDMIEKNPVFGVGPGRFKEEINKTILRFSVEHPRLWYAYMLVQRGHSHNDVFYLLAVAGPLSLLMYFLFFGDLLLLALTRSPSLRPDLWKWAPFAMLFAGLFQCYFQDDETILPLWLYTGLFLREAGKAREQAS